MKKVFILAFVFFILISGLFLAADERIKSARREVKAGNYKNAQAILYDMLLPVPDSTYLAEAYFLLAKCSKTLSKANYYYKSLIQLPENRYTKLAKLYYAKNLICQQNYNDAKYFLTDIISKPLSSCTAEAYFTYAQISYRQEEYGDAITNYLNYINLGKNSSKKETSLLNIANSNMKLNNYIVARKNFVKLLGFDLGDKIKSYSLLKIAKTYEEEEDYKKANEYYQKLVNQYPYSNEYETAENRIIELAEKGMSIETEKYDTTDEIVEKHYVQLSAYTKKENAKKIRNEYSQKNIHTIMYDKIVNNTKYFCLAIGPYFSRQEAELKKRELKRQGISSFIYTTTDE